MPDLTLTPTQRALRQHLRSVRLAVWAVIITAVSVVLALLPLFGVLGFELAFATAVVGSLASADLGAAYGRLLRRLPRSPVELADGPARVVVAAAARAIGASLLLLAIPVVVMTLNAVRVHNCDWLFGLRAYLLLPVVSSVWATSIGLLGALASGDRRRLSVALPYLVIGASALLSLWQFYAAPAVFTYNPFVGYFPGNLYDEDIQLAAPLFWSRLWQGSLVLALYALAITRLDVPTLRLRLRRARPEGPRLRAIGVLVVSLAVFAMLGQRAAQLGFAIDADDVKAALGGRHETANFVIWFPRGGEIERDIALIAEDHEFRLHQAAKTLGVPLPLSGGKIHSLYFDDPETKHRLMGARNVYMAKPWRGEIYLNHQSFPHQVLRHEIAHVVAGEFGDALFGVSARRVLGLPVYFNVGMIEGIAVAADWPDHFDKELTPHQAVKAMIELELAPPVDAVFSTGFLQFASARSYTLAGSVVRYLLDAYGADRLRVLYHSGGDTRAAYGRDQDDLVAEWRAFIDAIELPADAVEVVRERFRRPGILERPCPRAIAGRLRAAAEARGRGELERAVALLLEVCDDAPGEPRYQLEPAIMMVRAGMIEEARPRLAALADDDEHISSTLRAEALAELAGIEARAGDFAAAAALLARALALPLGGDQLRQLRAQHLAATHDGPAGPALRSYFWGYEPAFGYDPLVLVTRAARVVMAEPAFGLGYYLLGRAVSGRGAHADATELLSMALDLGLPGPLFDVEAARTLAASAYAAGDDAAVRRAAHILLRAGNTAVERLYGADWLERLEWRAARAAPAPPGAPTEGN